LRATSPLVAYILNMRFLSALLVDIGFVIFYLVYAFLYNYIFDRIYFEFIHK
ncbi:LysR family transcriptional regulator, partial [Francisella tularensis subsp. holarctica]|uniref:chlorhexidine efflux transporter n=1 Tax=Francisella tularensis TaxID=263 RepID=UPI0023819D72